MQVEKIAELKGHKGAVYALSGGILPNSILSGGSDQYLVQWDIYNPSDAIAIAKLPGIIYSIQYFSDEKKVLVGETHGGVHLIDVEKKLFLKSAPLHHGPVFNVKLLPDGKSFASVGSDGCLVIASNSDLSIIKKINLCEEKARGIAISNDGKEMAIACGDETIQIISLSDYSVKNIIQGHKYSVYAVAYKLNSDEFLSGARDAHLNIWDAKNNFQLIESIPAHNYAIYAIQFSADGKYFATASRDKTFKIWNAETNNVITRISKDTHNGHANSVNALYWNPQTGHIISAGDDATIMVWAIHE